MTGSHSVYSEHNQLHTISISLVTRPKNYKQQKKQWSLTHYVLFLFLINNPSVPLFTATVLALVFFLLLFGFIPWISSDFLIHSFYISAHKWQTLNMYAPLQVRVMVVCVCVCVGCLLAAQTANCLTLI